MRTRYKQGLLLGKKARTDGGGDIVKTFTPWTSTLLKFYYKNIFIYYIYLIKRPLNVTNPLYILLVIITVIWSSNSEQLQEVIAQRMNMHPCWSQGEKSCTIFTSAGSNIKNSQVLSRQVE